MTLFHLFLVAAIQGLTEFLPVSSSGHLILLPQLRGMEDQGAVIDVAVHVGSLFAVILYFRQDVAKALGGLGRLARGRLDTQGAFLALCLCISCVPVFAFGAFLYAADLTGALRSTAVIGWTMLGFGLLLYWADQRGATTREAEEWTLKHAIIMGLWQAVALIPGTSRSGITITGGRMLGYDRESAARLAMLMSIPTILGSGILLGADVVADANAAMARDAALAALMAFGAALLALKLMMKLLRSVSFTPYVIYRVALGLLLLSIAYLG